MALDRFHAKSIRQKFTTGLVLIVCSTMVLFSAIVMVYDLKEEKTNLRRRLDLFLTESSSSLSSALWQYNELHVQDHVKALFLNPDVAFVQVKDHQNIIMEKQVSELAAHSMDMIKNSPDFFWDMKPILYQKKPVGTIFIAMTQNRLRQRMVQESVTTLMMGIVNVLAIFAAVFFLTRNIIFKPLSRLEASVNEISKGRMNTKIETKGSDEIAGLAKAFAKMMQSQEKTTASKKELEKEIQERQIAQEKLIRSLDEKEVLLREVHHRVKNNMQMIQSLLSLQMRETDSEEMRHAFKDANSRIRSMSLMHETLYRSNDLASLDVKAYFENITQSLRKIYQHPGTQIELLVEAQAVPLDIDTAIPCGLIVNELVTNSLKHGFTGAIRQGRIRVGVEKNKEGGLIICVSDNGQGLPEKFHIETIDSLGLSIVKMLAQDQLNGDFIIRQGDELSFEITLPREV